MSECQHTVWDCGFNLAARASSGKCDFSSLDLSQMVWSDWYSHWVCMHSGMGMYADKSIHDAQLSTQTHNIYCAYCHLSLTWHLDRRWCPSLVWVPSVEDSLHGNQAVASTNSCSHQAVITWNCDGWHVSSLKTKADNQCCDPQLKGSRKQVAHAKKTSVLPGLCHVCAFQGTSMYHS